MTENLHVKIAQSIIEEMHEGAFALAADQRADAQIYAQLAIAEELARIAAALDVLTEHVVNR